MPPAPAVTFTVNSANDGAADFAIDPGFTICRTNVNNNTCTLRAAVMNANRRQSGATINLPAGSYFLTILPSAPNDDATGNLNISTTVTLAGAGAAGTIIDGGHIDGVFRIAATAAMTIAGVTIQNGSADSIFSLQGGAIDNRGWLNLSGVALVDNHAAVSGGGLFNQGTAALDQVTVAANNVNGSGGGIDNQGVMTITSSTLSGNRVPGAGGGLMNESIGTVTVFNSTISDNSSQNSGGGVFNFGTASFLASTIAGNLADSAALGGRHGGGIDSFAVASQLKIANTLLADNFVSVTLNECSGQLTSQDYNEFQTTTAALSWARPLTISTT